MPPRPSGSCAGQEELARREFEFFQLLDVSRIGPAALFVQLADDPDLFVELVSRVYRASSAPRTESTREAAAEARHAWRILRAWKGLPGRRDDGTIDGDRLRTWVTGARAALAEADRADIGDQQIGDVLSASPPGSDGAWPAEVVRDILEDAASDDLDVGLRTGRSNRRRVTSRGVFDGGAQERDQASRYGAWAEAVSPRWPRSAEGPARPRSPIRARRARRGRAGAGPCRHAVTAA